MTIDLSFSIYLLLISQSLLLGAACIALSKFQSRWRELENFWNSPTGALLDDEKIEQSASETLLLSQEREREIAEKIALEQRVTSIQQRLETIGNTDLHHSREFSFENVRSLPIENALRMAKNGASVESLTQNCGLNVGEARLLQKLHGPAQLQANRG